MGQPVRIIPPLYCLACLVLMAALHYWLPLARLLETPWRFSAAAIMGAGVVITAVAARLFTRLGTPVRPFEEPQLLVTEGLFAYSRNPMYLGMVLFLAGFALVLGTASPWLVIPVFVAVLHYGFIRPEEAGLAARYGDTYERYRGRVRRWL